MKKTNKAMSFAGLYIEKRTRKNTFFKHINSIIDWAVLEKEIDKVYKKGKSVDGRPSYRGLLLFKMTLLSYWYQLSDEKTEEMVNENLSAMMFCGLQLEDDVPDHSTLSRFRNELTEKKAFDRILRKVNKQLEAKKIKITGGKGIVDASLTDSPFNPKGKTTYEVAEDRKEDERSDDDKDAEQNQAKVNKKEQPGTDTEGRWVKKQGELHFGYKKHLLTNEDGLVEAVHTTTANEHDSKGLKPLLEKVKSIKIKEVYTDKGFKVPDNDQVLNEKGLKNRIQHKAYRNKPLTEWEKKFNKVISRSRYVVERTFGSMKRWFGAGRARYKGLNKVHSQHVLEAISYNLYRAPGLVCAYA
jgi:IS5 family transposase